MQKMAIEIARGSSTDLWLDSLPASAAGKMLAWHGLGDEPLGNFDRHFLHWLPAWSPQLYIHNARPARQGHDIDAPCRFATWAWFITSCIALLAFAVLLPACILLILDRTAGTSFFIPSGLVVSDRLQPHSAGVARFSGSTCSGSSAILRFTLRFCLPWESFSHILINSMRKPLLQRSRHYLLD